MKSSILFLLAVFLFSASTVAQDNNVKTFTVQNSKNESRLTEYNLNQINKYLRLPPEAEKLKPGAYRIYISFFINEDNSITDLKIKKDPGYGMGEAFKKAFLALAQKEPDVLAGFKGDNKTATIMLPFTYTIK